MTQPGMTNFGDMMVRAFGYRDHEHMAGAEKLRQRETTRNLTAQFNRVAATYGMPPIPTDADGYPLDPPGPCIERRKPAEGRKRWKL